MPCIWFLLMIRPQVSCGGFLPPGDSSRRVFAWLIFTSRVRVPTEAGIISRLSMIFRQRFLTGLTFRAFLRRLLILLLFGRRLLILLLFRLVLKDSLVLVHLFSVFFIVKTLGVNDFLLFCRPRFEKLAEKDDKQLSRQLLSLGLCWFWRASDRPSRAGDSIVLRRFVVSVGRAPCGLVSAYFGV